MSKAATKIVTSISYTDVKKGDVIQLQGDSKSYVVFQHRQNYHLLPIDLEHQKVYNIYDIHKPEIINIFDGKNGSCKMHKDELIMNIDEEIDDEIF